ncbi:MAG: hypothetical protein C5S48_01240 [Candidatus Methanogaster sp.]|nr:MAG: hypothetical protein C5S48_01240 [ANME-2 cluster archaeon]
MGKLPQRSYTNAQEPAKENMGLTNWTGNTISKSEAGIAKNYLNSEELEMLNRIVMAYLEFAEIQAWERKVHVYG